MTTLFISYSHLDSDYAHALADSLKDEFQVWIDDRIDYGETWPHVIQENLDKANAVLVVMTPRSYKSEWVQSELNRAKRKGKLVFPLLLEGEPWLSVEALQYLDVTDGRLPPSAFRNRLKKALGSRGRLDFAAAAQVLNSGGGSDLAAVARALKGEKTPQNGLRKRKLDEVLKTFARVLQKNERWAVGLHEVHSTTIKTLGLYLYAEVNDLERLALYAPTVHEEYSRYLRDEQIKAGRRKAFLAQKPDPSDPAAMMEHFMKMSEPSNNFMGELKYLRDLGVKLIWYPKQVGDDLTPMAQELLEVNAKLGLPLELTAVSLIGLTPPA